MILMRRFENSMNEAWARARSRMLEPGWSRSSMILTGTRSVFGRIASGTGSGYWPFVSLALLYDRALRFARTLEPTREAEDRADDH